MSSAIPSTRKTTGSARPTICSIDDDGQFRYFVITLDSWASGQKILLPVGCARIDYEGRKVHADTLVEDTSVGYDGYDRDTYTYSRDLDLYTMDDRYHASLKKYQDRYRASRATDRERPEN